MPTAATVAVNAALVEPADTVTDAGTVTAELLLVIETTVPPDGAAADNATLQPILAEPVMED